MLLMLMTCGVMLSTLHRAVSIINDIWDYLRTTIVNSYYDDQGGAAVV